MTYLIIATQLAEKEQKSILVMYLKPVKIKYSVKISQTLHAWRMALEEILWETSAEINYNNSICMKHVKARHANLYLTWSNMPYPHV